MTEAEWLACRKPGPMIEYLEVGVNAPCRKLRLFGVACCRRVWHLLAHQQARESVEVAELYADGLVRAARLRAAHRKSSALCKTLHLPPESIRMDRAACNAAVAADWVCAGDDSFRTNPRINELVPGGYAAAAAAYVAGATADAAFYATYQGDDALDLAQRRNAEGLPTPADPIWAAEEEAQSGVLRCIFGNPFRPPCPLPSALLTWNDGTIPRLARSIYEERRLPGGDFDPERLAVLADALEDAGCEDEELLAHVRSPGPHVRGCWAVAALAGRT
jgi:hypothetical protein